MNHGSAPWMQRTRKDASLPRFAGAGARFALPLRRFAPGRGAALLRMILALLHRAYDGPRNRQQMAGDLDGRQV